MTNQRYVYPTASSSAAPFHSTSQRQSTVFSINGSNINHANLRRHLSPEEQQLHDPPPLIRQGAFMFDDSIDPICRICYGVTEDYESSHFIRPCQCRGPINGQHHHYPLLQPPSQPQLPPIHSSTSSSSTHHHPSLLPPSPHQEFHDIPSSDNHNNNNINNNPPHLYLHSATLSSSSIYYCEPFYFINIFFFFFFKFSISCIIFSSSIISILCKETVTYGRFKSFYKITMCIIHNGFISIFIIGFRIHSMYRNS
ncbi:hypothetical protein BDA99DRAFT_311269 [Phascolomyces articulosus]|uniref:Uncharacterized protein n=1 Tax=Phascolomyces articulosus TaxID=60185 RepID=A0AAD5JWI2_9FUNG|nr:hypothetical protein BDA99DRAFT_311269 [Phascolomyces articulosus]